MHIRFRINYYTQPGQNVCIIGSDISLGGGDYTKAIIMTYTGNGDWETKIEISSNDQISYRYFIIENSIDQIIDREWGDDRVINVRAYHKKNIFIHDSWRPRQDVENAWMSAAFTKNLLKRKAEKISKKGGKGNVIFRLVAPMVGADKKICIVGSSEELGNWNPDKAVIMEDDQYPVWTANLDFSDRGREVEYKYSIYDPETNRLIDWEYGENRLLDPVSATSKEEITIITDQKFRDPKPLWRGAGVAIPVFSLRSENSFGVGEFTDLKTMIDWAKTTGLKLIQILPINDTVATHRWHDSYPYAAISVFALHPIYLNLRAMGKLKDKKAMQAIEEEGRMLNELRELDYEAVMKLKSRYYKQLYDQERDVFLKDKKYKAFFDANKEWLVPYAAFSRLRDLYKTPDFTSWEEYSVYNEKDIKRITDPRRKDYDDYAVHYFIQYHLHLQMQEVADYAREHGVVLKGDIPIGIYRNSVDAWVAPHLYHMEKQAGAPPDAYAVSGQNWRFPTYNWEEMAKDGYQWWRKRLSKMSTYFDAYRIDHILGFFRIWEIPIDSIEGLMGRFNPAIPIYKYEMYGLAFNYERYCKPYIREYMLEELFGSMKFYVAGKFMDNVHEDIYQLKPKFDTQRKVHDCIEEMRGGDFNDDILDNIRNGLFTLISNVLMLEEPGSEGEAFHPRIALHNTYSYKELDEASKHALDRIYNHYFYEKQESYWQQKAMEKLPAITRATDMLVCGEDLGMVPACVEGVMDELGILNLEIQRMPKNPAWTFGHTEAYRYMSVVSPSCHDMSTIRGWWQEDSDLTKKYFHDILGHFGHIPETCEPWICNEIVWKHLISPAMWAIFPVQDLVGMDEGLRVDDPFSEQINVPSNPNHYWKFRMHLKIEDLINAGWFNDMLRRMISESGRSI